MTSFFIITAISVSIDSLFCGFSLSYGKKGKLQIILGIFLTVFLMCLIANYTAIFLGKFLTAKTASIGGIILIGLGVFNIFHKEKKKDAYKSVFKQAIACGFAVGLDGALANLSLAIMGVNAFYVPLFIAFCHAVMVGIGMILSTLTLKIKAEKLSIISPLILIALGVYKLTFLL